MAWLHDAHFTGWRSVPCIWLARPRHACGEALDAVAQIAMSVDQAFLEGDPQNGDDLDTVTRSIDVTLTVYANEQAFQADRALDRDRRHGQLRQ